jgi:hypothetical protein
MNTLLVIGGTWETKPWGQCGPIVKNIPQDWNAVWVPYPAKYAGVQGYKNSYTKGKHNLWDQINKTDGKFAILGYSQGAKIAGDVSMALNMDSRLLRSYLIADPERHVDDQLIGPAVAGQGVYGQRRVGPKCRQFAQPGDIVCANQNPALHFMAGTTAMLCIQHPLIWMRDAGTKPWPSEVGKQTILEIKNFIRSQVHVSYNKYEVMPGTTVTDWIINDLDSLE